MDLDARIRILERAETVENTPIVQRELTRPGKVGAAEGAHAVPETRLCHISHLGGPASGIQSTAACGAGVEPVGDSKRRGPGVVQLQPGAC